MLDLHWTGTLVTRIRCVQMALLHSTHWTNYVEASCAVLWSFMLLILSELSPCLGCWRQLAADKEQEKLRTAHPLEWAMALFKPLVLASHVLAMFDFVDCQILSVVPGVLFFSCYNICFQLMSRYKDFFCCCDTLRKIECLLFCGSLDPWIMMGSFEIHGVCCSIFTTVLLELFAWHHEFLQAIGMSVGPFPGSGSRRERADASPSAGWWGSSTSHRTLETGTVIEVGQRDGATKKINRVQHCKLTTISSIYNCIYIHHIVAIPVHVCFHQRPPRYRKRFRNWSKSKRMRRKRLLFCFFFSLRRVWCQKSEEPSKLKFYASALIHVIYVLDLCFVQRWSPASMQWNAFSHKHPSFAHVRFPHHVGW